MKTINIFGAGSVGRSLGYLLSKTSTVRLQDIFCRSSHSAEKAIAFMEGGVPRSFDSSCLFDPADFTLIGVPDQHIANAVKFLVTKTQIRPESVYFHCSGAHNSDLLIPLRDKGAYIASMHPIHSFANPRRSIKQFTGTLCTLEGDQKAVDAITQLLTEIEAEIAVIDADKKPLYHCAMCICSNYLVTLMSSVENILAHAGISKTQGLAMMKPLAKQTMENILTLGPENALTGPISRGDVGTIQVHYDALDRGGEATRELKTMYSTMGLATLEISHSLDDKIKKNISEILTNSHTCQKDFMMSSKKNILVKDM